MKTIRFKLLTLVVICLMTVFCVQLPVPVKAGVCQDNESMCRANCPSPQTEACIGACVDGFEACCKEVPSSQGCPPLPE